MLPRTKTTPWHTFYAFASSATLIRLRGLSPYRLPKYVEMR